MKKNDYEDAIEREVQSWPGVKVEFVSGGKHPKARFTFGDVMLHRPYPSSPSDSAFGIHRCLDDMRRIMKQLGAERATPEPGKDEDEAPYRKANDGAAKRPDPVKSEPAPPVKGLFERMSEAGLSVVKPEVGVFDPGANTPPIVASVASVPDRAAFIAEAVAAIVDGIYFDLDDDIYHAVPALGSGSINKLLISPATFWQGSWLDPNRPPLDEDQTAAQLLGKVYHTARLEPDKLAQRFIRQPVKSDFPADGMITSDAGVKAALKEMGAQQTITGESAEERAERLEDSGYDGTIWPLELARWQRTVSAMDPVPVPIRGDLWDEMLIDMERYQNSPVADLTDGGQAEVSVFWTDEHGLRCKARFDKLLAEHWVDFKTFANPNGKVLDQALADAFRYNRYYCQGVHYGDASEAIRTGGLQIIGEASDEARSLIAAIQIAPRRLGCWYVFQEKGGIPNLLARRFQFFAVDSVQREHEMRIMAGDDPVKLQMLHDALGQKTGLYKRGRMEVERAKREFALYAQVYQPGEPWAPIEPMRPFDDEDFSRFWLEEAN